MNAAVVGILAAAFVNPIVLTSIHSIVDVAVALLFYFLLAKAKLQPIWIVLLGLVTGIFI